MNSLVTGCLPALHPGARQPRMARARMTWHKRLSSRQCEPSAPHMDSVIEPDPVAGLLAGVAAGRRDALDALYQATSATLMGICVSLLRDRQDAEDVLQDVFVTVWAKAGQFDASRARGMTWLGSIARNRAIDRLRGRRQGVHDAIDDHPELADASESPASSASRAQEGARLDDCVERLEPNRRQLIRVAFFEGLTYEELAHRTQTPLGTVKSWIRRGLQQLRACLEA